MLLNVECDIAKISFCFHINDEEFKSIVQNALVDYGKIREKRCRSSCINFMRIPSYVRKLIREYMKNTNDCSRLKSKEDESKGTQE